MAQRIRHILAFSLSLLVFLSLPQWAACSNGDSEDSDVSLLGAVIIVDESFGSQELAAVHMFQGEVRKRAQQQMPVTYGAAEAARGNGTSPVILFWSLTWGQTLAAPAWCTPSLAGVPVHPESMEQPWMTRQRENEGYCIDVDSSGPQLVVRVSAMMATSQGILYGAGRLLREMSMEVTSSYDSNMPAVSVTLPSATNITTYPEYWLRGQMISYRSISNTYDAWSLEMMEQYIVDMAVFGTNQIELVAPDGNDDPHFLLTPPDMSIGISQILVKYGLNASIWFPQDSPSWDLIPKMARLDSLFIPSGDPGSTAPAPFLSFVAEKAAYTHITHPDCQVWISCQDFNSTWIRELLARVNSDASVSQWLTGMVYGPSTRITVQQLRDVLDPSFPIRHYPDICHTMKCEFPVPDWDFALAFTEAREVVNPQPTHQERIFHLYQHLTIGFGTYSDGSKDDVNAVIWSALGWDSSQEVGDVLYSYGKYFVSPSLASQIQQGLLLMEANWEGSLLTNANVPATTSHFQAIEKAATAKDWMKWRLLMCLYRVHYDRFQQDRLLFETDQQDAAYATLAKASTLGVSDAIDSALEDLAVRYVSTDQGRAQLDWVLELAGMLLQSARMQLAIRRPFFASKLGRGDNLDTVMVPLNDARWLNDVLPLIKANLTSEAEQLLAISAVLTRTDPGPGGHYDDLGNQLADSHLLRGEGFETDPLFHFSSFSGFQEPFDVLTVAKVPNSYLRYAQTIYNQPLEMEYSDLNSNESYVLQIVYYNGDSSYNPIRLVAVVPGGLEGERVFPIHDYLAKPYPMRPLQYSVPADAIKAGGGSLTLRWNQPPGDGGDGESLEVAEVMLMTAEYAALRHQGHALLSSLSQ